MKHKDKMYGFSLIEFTIYLFGFMFFMQLLCLFISKSSSYFLLIDSKLSRLSTQQIVESLLYDDGSTASFSKHVWFIDTKNQHYIWRTASGDIGWKIKNGDLVRSIGVYDYVKNKWKQKKTSRILLGVHSLVITPLATNNYYNAITYTITYNLLDSEKTIKKMLFQQIPMKGRIEFKNRVLL